MKILLSLVGVILVAVAALQAGNLTADEESFLLHASQGGMTKVALGKLAMEKAANPDVKAFGAMLVKDHEKTNAEVEAMAAKYHLTLPAVLNAERAALVEAMSRMSGDAFDQYYLTDMVKDHETAITAFAITLKSATNPDVRAFATATLPILKMHLEEIQDIQKALKK